MKSYLTILTLFLLTSCQPKTIEKNGGLVIDLIISDSVNKEADVLSAVNIMKNRIDYLCYNNPRVILNADKKRIHIELPLEKDSLFYRDLLLRKGRFETLETYENPEVSHRLIEINKVLVLNHNFGLKINDSIQQSNEHPLFSILHPAVRRDNELTTGPVIGYSFVKDTAIVNAIFKYRQVLILLPRNFACKWSKFIDRNQMLSLVAIAPENKTIKGYMIKTAKASEGQMKNRYEVNFELKKEYHKDWAIMTKNNIGRALALVVDNEVYSSPTVNSEIRNGMSTISGIDLSLEQTKALAAILQYGELPVDLRIERIALKKAP